MIAVMCGEWICQNQMIFAATASGGRKIMYSETNKHCKECLCVTCEAFQTADCIDGKEMCTECDNIAHTQDCPGFTEREGE